MSAYQNTGTSNVPGKYPNEHYNISITRENHIYSNMDTIGVDCGYHNLSHLRPKQRHDYTNIAISNEQTESDLVFEKPNHNTEYEVPVSARNQDTGYEDSINPPKPDTGYEQPINPPNQDTDYEEPINTPNPDTGYEEPINTPNPDTGYEELQLS